MKNNKIILYGGGALVLGAVAFFVWSFFQKNKASNLDVEKAETIDGDKKDYTNVFSQMPTDFEPIRTPNIAANLQAMI
jgi:hypothetical protein